MEEDLSFECPHCHGLIDFDETGEPCAVDAELAENQHRGINGVVSIDATPGWRSKEYRFNQQGLDQPQQEVAPAPPIEQEPIEDFVHDAALQDVIDNDLSYRNLKLKLSNENNNDPA